jgi:hypothetical protein
MDSENQNLTPPIPPLKQSSNKLKIVALIIIVFLAVMVGAGAYFYFSMNTTKPAVAPQAKQVSLKPVTTYELARDMLSQSPITFPDITSSNPVASSTIPVLLSGMITPDAKNLQTFQDIFGNQKTGFTLTYEIPQNVQAAFTESFRLLLSPERKIIQADSTNQAAILISTTTAWQIKTVETYLDATNTAVSIIAVSQ